jgi:hypothetical protein
VKGRRGRDCKPFEGLRAYHFINLQACSGRATV